MFQGKFLLTLSAQQHRKEDPLEKDEEQSNHLSPCVFEADSGK